MKRKISYAFLACVVVFAAYRFLKKPVIDWYAANHYVRATDHPATPAPDQVWLAIANDPRTSQTVLWRTDVSVEEGYTQYREKAGDAVIEIPAKRSRIEDRLLENDPVNHRFSAVLDTLTPGTTYAYRVGSKSPEHWSEWAEFSTAPDEPAGFSFIYLGDPQQGLDFWGTLIDRADERFPSAAFYTIAGDIVDNGSFRDQWDQLFAEGSNVFAHRQVVPALGNHDYAKYEVPQMYLNLFTLPENGPKNLLSELAYSFRYGNALFVILDSNLPPADQTVWLEEQLAQTDTVWKFAVYHHPAYSAKENRDNPEVRELWGALFDKYHLDMALQGHDHAYLRTYPMRGGKRVESPKEGTIYVVSDSGTKFYEQDERDFTEVGFTNVSTYQVIDIAVNPDKLSYRVYDVDDKLRDELVIEK